MRKTLASLNLPKWGFTEGIGLNPSVNEIGRCQLVSRKKEKSKMAYTIVKNEVPSTLSTITDYFPNLEAWSVGFDREWRLLEKMQNALMGGTSSYPPYNIKQLSEDNYKIEMAVAGFSKAELRVELHNNQLSIEGSKQQSDSSSDVGYIYRGIAGRQFRQTFALADHVKVVGSELKDGILTVELVRDLPEEKKPRQIEIK